MITVRGSFRTQNQIPYELWISNLALGDPCSGLVYDIYRDPSSGIYYYYDTGVWNICDGIWYEYAYYDNWSYSYYYMAYYVSNTTFEWFGDATSQCAPYM